MTDIHGTAGPYSLKRLMATGSQSQVWHAKGPAGEVALKLARTEAHRAALKREVEVLSLGEHPGLPVLIEHAEDFEWVALEHIKGSQVDQWAQVQDIEDVVDMARQLLDVLEFLHGKGLLHGDVKPSNVLVDISGQVRLIDMGIASPPKDHPREFTGTLGYAAPELLQGRRPKIPTADLYGVGALLYTCLTGRPPFVAADPAALTYLPLVSLPAPPSAMNTDLPEVLCDLMLDLLSRDPRRRPGSIAEVRERLDQVAESVPPTPVLGMTEERETLRRAVVGASDGEPRVVVLYGPPGSGRRTLLLEAIQFATREGLTYVKGNDVRAILEEIKKDGSRVAAVLRGTSNNAQKLAALVLRDKLPSLILLHSDRPIPSLVSKGAIQLTPSPLSALDVTRLARLLGADEEEAAVWWTETFGLPIAVLGRIRAWRREHLGDDVHIDHLPAESRRILDSLEGGEPKLIQDLARALGHTENALLDHCEILFAEELIVPEDNGTAIALADGVSPA